MSEPESDIASCTVKNYTEDTSRVSKTKNNGENDDVDDLDDEFEENEGAMNLYEDFINEVEDSTEATDAGTADDGKSDDENETPEGLIGYKYKKVLKYHSPKSSLEPLPEGWLELSHSSGLPVYFHKPTRVVTWSRPYSLLTGYVMNHNVPLHSIPCLHYQKSKEKQIAASKINGEVTHEGSDENQPENIGESSNPKLDTEAGPLQPKVILHDQKDLSLTPEEFTKYLDLRFEFQTLEFPRFKKWSQRRNFNRNLRRKKLEEASSNAESDSKNGESTSGKLITLTVEDDGPGGSSRNRKFVLNTNGKKMICVLHEYAQRVLKVQPKYSFNIREDSAEPFEATINLNGKDYGTAVAINKKTAKNKAALATLEMLIPGFKGQVESTSDAPDAGYFGNVSVTDSRVYELCVHTGQLLPYQMLTECLKRNQGIADTSISYDVQQGKRKSLNYTMKCGKHVVNGVAKNKKTGKQVAAQQILSLLHPKVKTWSELIELYGTSLAQERANRKQQEQEIFDLKQRRGHYDDDRPSSSKQAATSEDSNSLEPNPELLAKLRQMMQKMAEERAKKRKSEEDNAVEKKPKLTPMAAAVAAGRGPLEIPCPNEVLSEKRNAMDCS